MSISIVDKLNTTNDTYIGKGSPTGIQTGGTVGLGGLLGKPITVDSAQALKLSDTTIGTLYQGKYVLVKLKASQTDAIRGNLAFFDVTTLTAAALDSYQVLTAVTAPTMGLCCGVFLNSVDDGKYCWIQVAGIATVLCDASVGGTTSGDLALVKSTPTNFVEAVADGTAGGVDTAGEFKRVIGVFLEAPANDGLKRINLFDKGFYPALGQLY